MEMSCRFDVREFAPAGIEGAAGFAEFEMKQLITSRVLAVALILSVGLFAMQTAGHWHGHASDEQHCQVCHVGHIAVPQPAARVALLAPATVTRFVASNEESVEFETLCTHRSPRAPPV
jgi:hypothetical protein